MGRTRLFTAVEVGDAIRGHAIQAQRLLATTGAEVKWVPTDQFHITLNFLGEVDDRESYSISRVLTHVAKSEEPFALRLRGIGAFPTLRRPKVLWSGITDGADSLTRIAERLFPKLSELGVCRKEERGYTPHLTLGRVKEEADGALIAPELTKFADWPGGDTLVEEIVLMSSELTRAGPEYLVVARAPLLG